MLMQPIHIKEYIEHMAIERHRKAFNEVGEVDFSSRSKVLVAFA